jgi:hypothetical protein
MSNQIEQKPNGQWAKRYSENTEGQGVARRVILPFGTEPGGTHGFNADCWPAWH